MKKTWEWPRIYVGFDRRYAEHAWNHPGCSPATCPVAAAFERLGELHAGRIRAVSAGGRTNST